VIEKASAHEIQGEINKGGGWELFSFQVVVQGHPSLHARDEG